jgi:homoserine kinase
VKATAFAPASVGNVAVGFDMLGHALEGPGDRATVTLNQTGEVRIRSIRGVVDGLPLEPARNTAGRALMAMLAHVPKGLGFDLELEKGIALGSGMGGSAASAVAALVAANAALRKPLAPELIYQLAMDGESVSAGSRHGDNVGPMLLGGLVICPSEGAAVKVPVPEWLHLGLVHPHFVLETRVARAALAGPWALGEFVHQSEGLALVLAGCFQGSAALLRRGLKDVLVEPRRASLIPGFSAVKQAALDGGALGASISGAGPSVFGWFESKAAAEQATLAMARAFADAGLSSDRLVSRVDAPGARVESCVV